MNRSYPSPISLISQIFIWNSSFLCQPVMKSKEQRHTKWLRNNYESDDSLYKNLKILNFQDIVLLKNCLFMCQLEQNKKLAAIFPGLVYTKEKHKYNIRIARKNLLDIPLCQTFTYGTQSCKYHCVKYWNRFKKKKSTENLTSVVKNIFKKMFWHPISLSSQISDLFDYSTCLRNGQRKKWNSFFKVEILPSKKFVLFASSKAL